MIRVIALILCAALVRLAAGLVTREALPTCAGQRRASGRHSGSVAGLPVDCRRASGRADVPGWSLGSIADVRRATSGFRPSLGKRCRASGPLPTCRACRRAGHSGGVADVRRASGRLPPGWSRSACRRASRRAGLPARCRAGHSGSVADVRRATSGFRPSLGKRKQTGKGLPCPCESETTCQTAP
jgi:hypothetical protein